MLLQRKEGDPARVGNGEGGGKRWKMKGEGRRIIWILGGGLTRLHDITKKGKDGMAIDSAGGGSSRAGGDKRMRQGREGRVWVGRRRMEL